MGNGQGCSQDFPQIPEEGIGRIETDPSQVHVLIGYSRTHEPGRASDGARTCDGRKKRLIFGIDRPCLMGCLACQPVREMRDLCLELSNPVSGEIRARRGIAIVFARQPIA